VTNTEIPIAFWGRVSTEDNQDPESSRGWQLTRAKALIEPHGGGIVAEFFDVDKSRSIPPQRRPEAARLLSALADPRRGFDAVVVGEPQRAFYGNQFGNTFPLFAHYKVPLWVPEVGGPIDPDNEAHDLIMSVFGGVSKGERNRVRIRVRTAMTAQAQLEGRFLGGRPPYGYKLIDAGPHPNPAKAADGRRLHALAPDLNTADVVRQIFAEYLGGKGAKAIAEALTRDGIPSPSGYDQARNPHRCGLAWSQSAVRTILANPRYTGAQVWNKQRKDEVLMDVNDVALGHTTVMRWNDRASWVWSERAAQPALIDSATFERAQALRQGRAANAQRAARPSPRPYALRGLLFCGICQRRMQGSWNNQAIYYRCMFLAEYAASRKISHPRAVYLREEKLTVRLDEWLAGLFRADHLPATIETLARARDDGLPIAAVEQARRVIADCDAKLRQHRAALEAGADPAVIARWMTETQARRAEAEARLRPGTHRQVMTADQIAARVAEIGDIPAALASARPDEKAQLYGELGLTMIYDPSASAVRVTARPLSNMYVKGCPRGDLNPHALLGH
jgi:site-specific DNA recombinase